MSSPRRSDRAGKVSALLAAAGLAGIVVFQLALVAGAPWGHAAWGGAHAQLSNAQRVGSAVAAGVWALAALVLLGRGGVWGAGRAEQLFRRGTWLAIGLLVLGSLPNFASQSRWETLLFGPLSLLLAGLAAIVARSAARSGEPESPGASIEPSARSL